MKKKLVYDIVFYLIVPLLIWNWVRKGLGDYYTMLLTTIPGFIYTIFFFIKDKTYNVTGIFMLVSLFSGRILDILSGSAERMLWNDIYINIVYIFFWLTTILIKKPMGMYFFIDYAYAQGFNREKSKKLYLRKGLFKYFQYLTALFAIRDLEQILLKIWAIKTYGVTGFNQISIVMRINGYIFTGIIILFILFIVNLIKKSISKVDAKKTNFI